MTNTDALTIADQRELVEVLLAESALPPHLGARWLAALAASAPPDAETEREALLKIIRHHADISPLWRGKMADTILAAGFTRPAPATDAEGTP